MPPCWCAIAAAAKGDAVAWDWQGDPERRVVRAPWDAWTTTSSPPACAPGATAWRPPRSACRPGAGAARPGCGARRSPSWRASRSTTSRAWSRAAPPHPSPSVLAPLARALRLTDDERAHLFRVAGQAAAAGRPHRPPRHARRAARPGPPRRRPGRWSSTRPTTSSPPTRSAVALIGDAGQRAEPRERNIAWRSFTGAPSRFVRDPASSTRHGRRARRRPARARSAATPRTPALRALIDDLLRGVARASPRCGSGAPVARAHGVAQDDRPPRGRADHRSTATS